MTAASEAMSLAREYLRNSLADSAAFRAWVGAAGDDAQAQARARIHYGGLPGPSRTVMEYTLAQLQAMRPYALLSTRRFRSERVGMSDTCDYADDGTLTCLLVQDVPPRIKRDLPELEQSFENTLGAIIADLKDLSGDSSGSLSYLAFQSLEMPDAWIRSHPDEEKTEGDVVVAELIITW